MRKNRALLSSADGPSAAGTLHVIATHLLLHGRTPRMSGSAAMKEKTCADDVQGPSSAGTLPLVTFADDRQRHADEWWPVELATPTAV